MKTNIILTIQFVFIILISCISSNAEGFELPGFEGYILDEASGKPIENAYVICFTSYYSFGQRFNFGGPNSYPDSMQITKTDKNGFFRIESYTKYSGGWTDVRIVYYFKEGYIYARGYLQLTEKKNMLRKKYERYRPSEEIRLKGPIKIYLSNKEDRDIDGEVMINDYLGLLYSARYYHNHFKENNKTEFKRLKPIFMEVYRVCEKHSDDIIKTFTEPHLVYNWKNELKWFKEDLEADRDTNNGITPPSTRRRY